MGHWSSPLCSFLGFLYTFLKEVSLSLSIKLKRKCNLLSIYTHCNTPRPCLHWPTRSKAMAAVISLTPLSTPLHSLAVFHSSGLLAAPPTFLTHSGLGLLYSLFLIPHMVFPNCLLGSPSPNLKSLLQFLLSETSSDHVI